MDIKIIGDKALQKNADPIKEITDEIVNLSSEMIVVMSENNGVGLAATQLGINKRLIIIDYKPDGKNISLPMTEGEAFLIPQMPVALVNPEILSYSDSKVTYEEGCLSVPKVYADVVRSSKVAVKVKLLNDDEICIECGGLLSVILQHEIDHLNGILFVDRLESDQLEKIKLKINKLKARHHK
jgi:peptide deformylase